MKIAQIAPLMESVPPRLYGGTERVVSYLTDELVRLGHKVTVFASGDSISTANLVRCVPTALRLNANVRDPIPYYMLMLDRVRELADEFDVLHFHIDQFHFPLFHRIANKTVTTLHGRQDLPHRYTWVSAICRWCRSPMRSAARFPTRTLSPRSITAFHCICSSRPAGRAAATWRSSDASLQRSGPTVRYGSRRRSDCRSRSPLRSTKSTKHISGKESSRCSISLASNLLGRLMSVPRASSWAMRERSYSRSTGPSRLDCR